MKWIIAVILAASGALAQEPPTKELPPDQRRNQGAMAAMKQRHDEALENLKKDDPKEYERLMTVKETDRRQFYREMMKLVKPVEGQGGRGDRDKRDGHRHGSRIGGEESKEQFTKRFMDHMEKIDPKRAKELQELLRTDPEKGRKAIRDILMSFKNKHFSGKGDERVETILKNYKTADDAKKKELEADLRKLVEESFEKRMQMKQRELDYMKKRIAGLEEALKKYAESKDDLCDKRVADLLRRAQEDPQKEGVKVPGDGRDRHRPPPPPRPDERPQPR